VNYSTTATAAARLEIILSELGHEFVLYPAVGEDNRRYVLVEQPSIELVDECLGAYNTSMGHDGALRVYF
jgi:hypothetical protein